jgi:hypothetical protein
LVERARKRQREGILESGRAVWEGGNREILEGLCGIVEGLCSVVEGLCRIVEGLYKGRRRAKLLILLAPEGFSCGK